MGAVPKLYDLFFVIDRGFRARDHARTVAEVEQQMTTACKVHLALLRMIPAHHYLHRPPGESSSQWEVIDDQLEQLKTWSVHQKQA